MEPQIIDVRNVDNLQSPQDGSGSEDLREQIIQGLSKSTGQKTLPTMLLYDERGLQLYDTLTTHCTEYYLFAAEVEILENNVDDIVRLMHSRDSESGGEVKPVVVELGAGSLRKTSHILLALSRLASSSRQQVAHNDKDQARITYFALDLERRELERTLSEFMTTYGDELRGKVEMKGMWGTYDGGLKFIQDGGLYVQTECLTHSVSTQDCIGYTGRQDASAERGNDCGTHRNVSPHVSRSDDSSLQSYSTNVISVSPPTLADVGSRRRQKSATPPLHILFLGSSLGNFDRKSAASFLRSLPLRPGSGDTLLIGLDHDNEKDKVERAYDDPKGHIRNFIMNGLKVAGRTLGNENLFEEGRWEYVNRYNVDERRHEGYYRSMQDQTLPIPGTDELVSFLAGELINVEIAVKYSDEDAYSMFTDAMLRPIMRWTDSQGQYSLWLLERPSFVFPLLKSPDPFDVPALEDFESLWKAWDTITLDMLPRSMLFTRPIDLRHICLFYLGHTPAFLDTHISKLLREPHTEPEYFKDIFEADTDPHADDHSSQSHPRSEVLQNDDEWPTLESIIQFRDRVRARVMRLYEDLETGKRQFTRKVSRALVLTFGHAGLHVEALLYMLLQHTGVGGGTLPPPGFTPPNWKVLAKQWDAAPPPAESTVTLGPETVTIGHDYFEELDEDSQKRNVVDDIALGWSNEHPKREVHVDKFQIEWRPVSNGEFYEFYNGAGQGKVQLPASWVEIDGDVQIRTLYGRVSMEHAKHWPVLTSYDNLSKYAQVKGGRLPTEAELLLFFDKFECGHEGGANVGFRNWHPVLPTAGGKRNGGKGHNGGVWEWTSTLFDTYERLLPPRLYPGYSADFFDGKHQVVIAGSFSTTPLVANRRAVRNVSQHKDPYPWVGGRIAYDV